MIYIPSLFIWSKFHDCFKASSLILSLEIRSMIWSLAAIFSDLQFWSWLLKLQYLASFSALIQNATQFSLHESRTEVFLVSGFLLAGNTAVSLLRNALMLLSGGFFLLEELLASRHTFLESRTFPRALSPCHVKSMMI